VKIVDIRLGLLRTPLKTPFVTALRRVEAAEDIVVAIQSDDGRFGYGSTTATAAITGDTHSSIVAAIRHYIRPRLIGQDVDDLNHALGLVQNALERNGSAKAAVEIALHDLWAQRHGAPLYRLLGGGTPTLSTDITISVDSIDKMVADALSAIERGYTALKIKLGKDGAQDIERVRQIHAAVAGRASLRLDPNQAWTPKQAVRTMQALEDSGIAPELLEQPVKAHDIAGLRFVSERIATPVLADESVFDAAQAVELIRTRSADLLNIKLMKAGGISGALRIAEVAAAFGVECMIGCMLEGPISVAAAAHLAAANSATITKVDLDGPALCASIPVESGTHFSGSRIDIDESPGLGIRAIHGLEPLLEPT